MYIVLDFLYPKILHALLIPSGLGLENFKFSGHMRILEVSKILKFLISGFANLTGLFVIIPYCIFFEFKYLIRSSTSLNK